MSLIRGRDILTRSQSKKCCYRRKQTNSTPLNTWDPVPRVSLVEARGTLLLQQIILALVFVFSNDLDTVVET